MYLRSHLLWTPYGADLSARSASAIKKIRAVGFEAADEGALRHRETLEHCAILGVDAPDVAFVAFPGAVPQLAFDPGHAGDEAIGLDGAPDRASVRIDLVDFPIAV